jgi:bleomycin hydrolase
MGSSQSSHSIPSPKVYLNEDEKDVDISESPSVLLKVTPLSIDGSLTLKNVKTWESFAAANSKLQLARTILSQSNITSVLSSRSARIADQHIFNNVLDFKTGPITNQKSSGRCWLFATTNVIRYGIMRKLKLKEFQLSQVRLIRYHLLLRPLTISRYSLIFSSGINSTNPTTTLNS